MLDWTPLRNMAEVDPRTHEASWQEGYLLRVTGFKDDWEAYLAGTPVREDWSTDDRAGEPVCCRHIVWKETGFSSQEEARQAVEDNFIRVTSPLKAAA